MTSATIGIQIGNKVTYSICAGLGDLSHTGVILNKFYDTDEKVKELISLGFIHTLGAKVRDESNSGINLKLINYAYDDFLKEKITLPVDYFFDKETTFNHHTETVDVDMFAYHGQQYNYLYDTSLHIWYVCSYDKKTLKTIKHNLEKVITNTECLKNYCKDSGNVDCKYQIDESRKVLRMNVVKYLNNMLVSYGIQNYKIDVKQDKQGNNVYGLYQVPEDKTKKRKCIVRSPYAYQLIMYMACYYTGNGHTLSTLRENSNQYKHLLQIEVVK